MESTDKRSTSPKSEAAPPPSTAPSLVNCFFADVILRVLLFAASVVAVVVMVTSKQTEILPILVQGLPGPGLAPREAKFNHSPALIYFVAALSVAGLYSIITILVSVVLKPAFSKTFLLHFALSDVLMLGVVASATGAAGGVAYIGLKGNKHVGWTKVCNVYDKFCDHVVSSIAMALLASILLVFLCMLSIFSLHKRIRD